jgi:hypothetical protein
MASWIPYSSPLRDKGEIGFLEQCIRVGAIGDERHNMAIYASLVVNEQLGKFVVPRTIQFHVTTTRGLVHHQTAPSRSY